jgi:ornithine carbamoyltransferase
VPVVNALSDHEHPCQALADLLTLRQHLGELRGRTVAFVGDGNNVCHSLMRIASRLGMDFVAATPPGYEPAPDVVASCLAEGGRVELTADPRAAGEGAHAIYTDVWTSMGQEDEAEARRRAFADYTVDAPLLALADPDAIVLHCLPAHPGEEVAADVLYGARSAVWDEAENRLHTAKALLALTVG